MLGRLGNDYPVNLNIISRTCAKTFNASTTLYYHQESGIMIFQGLPDQDIGFSLTDDVNQRMMAEVTNRMVDGFCLVENLQDSTFAEPNPMIREGQFLSLFGHVVKSNKRTVGTLCMLFSRQFKPSGVDRKTLSLFAQILGREESGQELQKKIDGLESENAKLSHMNFEKDNFFSIMAHDLRSPFNGFLGLTYLLAEESHQMTPSELSEIGATLRKSASNIYSLLENLLEWSRIQRGVASFDPENVVLLDILARVLDPIIESAKNKNIRINIDIPDQIEVYADVRMMETVFRNIVSNCIKFTHHGGRVELSAILRPDETVLITIQDNGTGMSQELCDKLFNINEVVKRSGTDGEPSSGLGLIICREFIQKNQGTIWLESAENMGTTVYFTLPVPLSDH
jgi:signal transduction histidine kinase